MGQRRIAKALTEKGVETHNEWTPTAVARIMKRLNLVATSPPRRPPSQRWNAAVQVLIDLQAQYQIQLDTGPDTSQSHRLMQELEEICGHDVRRLRVG